MCPHIHVWAYMFEMYAVPHCIESSWPYIWFEYDMPAIQRQLSEIIEPEGSSDAQNFEYLNILQILNIRWSTIKRQYCLRYVKMIHTYCIYSFLVRVFQLGSFYTLLFHSYSNTYYISQSIQRSPVGMRDVLMLDTGRRVSQRRNRKYRVFADKKQSYNCRFI